MPRSRNADEVEAVLVASTTLANAIRQATKATSARSTSPKRRAELLESLRVLLRAERGIPAPEAKGYKRVLALNVEAWIQQARIEGHDAAWLRRWCITVDGRFAKLPMSAYRDALQGPARPRPGKRPTLRPACQLIVAARIHSSVEALRKGAANLKTDSKDVWQ